MLSCLNTVYFLIITYRYIDFNYFSLAAKNKDTTSLHIVLRKLLNWNCQNYLIQLYNVAMFFWVYSSWCNFGFYFRNGKSAILDLSVVLYLSNNEFHLTNSPVRALLMAHFREWLNSQGCWIVRDLWCLCFYFCFLAKMTLIFHYFMVSFWFLSLWLYVEDLWQYNLC